MRTNTVLGAVLVIGLLANALVGSTLPESGLLPLHGVIGAVALVLAVAYAYTGRKFRPALTLGILFLVLLIVQAALGQATLGAASSPNQAENPVAGVHRFVGWVGFLVGLVGVILVERAARRAQGR
jgi:FtsH-binding integral membrane protein